MYAQAHMHRYGTTTEQLAQIALNARRNAGLNPNAIYRDPLTLDDYLASRMITTPLRLFDCDVPVRRGDRRGRLPAGAWPPTCAGRRSTSRRWAPPSTTARAGTSCGT